MSYLKKSLIFLLVVAGLAVGWVVVTGSADDVANTATTLDIVSKTRFIRWTVIGSIIIFWSEIIEFLGRKQLTAEQIERGKTMHWRVAAALVAFELLVVDSVLIHIF